MLCRIWTVGKYGQITRGSKQITNAYKQIEYEIDTESISSNKYAVISYNMISYIYMAYTCSLNEKSRKRERR